MKRNENLTILLLSVSAVLLLATVAVITHTEQQATAAMSESRGGDYVWAAGQISANQDVVYVIDVANQAMQGYAVTRNSNSIERVPGAAVNLRVAFGSGGGGAGGGGAGGLRGR